MNEFLKNLIRISGPMGVGKTATCTELKKMAAEEIYRRIFKQNAAGLPLGEAGTSSQVIVA